MNALKALISSLFLRLTSVGRKKPQIKINLLSPSGNGRRRTDGSGAIRIRPVSAGESGVASGRVVIPPIPSGPAVAGAHTTGRLVSANINITDGVILCNACGEPLEKSDALARCQKDFNHTIHRKCLALMKNKCPNCGGRLSSLRA